jgi:putative acetyltransferase
LDSSHFIIWASKSELDLLSALLVRLCFGVAFGIVAGTTAGVVANIVIIALSFHGLRQWNSQQTSEASFEIGGVGDRWYGPIDNKKTFMTRNTPMKITDGGLDDPRVQMLLAHHFKTASAETTPASAHALDLSGLKSSDIHFWSAWDGDRVIAIGALKRLSKSHGEIKSMHTEQSHRRNGAGSAMLRHIIETARQIGLCRLSLETGSGPYFTPARELYRRQGFVECPPFGSYVPDANSVFMTLELRWCAPQSYGNTMNTMNQITNERKSEITARLRIPSNFGR